MQAIKFGALGIMMGLTLLVGVYARPADTIQLKTEAVNCYPEDAPDNINGMFYLWQCMGERIAKLEDAVFTKTRQAVTAEDNDQNKVIAELANKIDRQAKGMGLMTIRIAELERKVSGKDGKGGLQKQVTVLHSKKADK